MAYVSVVEWKTGHVCEWLKGLDSCVFPYIHSFMNHGINGQQLLNLRPEDLEQLGVLKLGHQEIILEAVEYLRSFHYELDRENLQLLALYLSCQALSLHNELFYQSDSRPVTTQTLANVASIMTAVKPLVCWLDRPPFSGQLEYNDKKAELLKLSLEMATCAQRDRFAERPVEEIRTICGQLAKLSDYIIQDIADPMILQPASLDLATLRKRPGDDLGFYILPSFHGAHQIAEIKFGSAAHQCGKVEEGDEIVQVNYQTVVGWEKKNVLELFRECPTEILLTLKRRPRHTKVYGQIYIKPYRLPSNKKTPYTTRWQHNLPSPRPELLTIPDFTIPIPRHVLKDPSPEPISSILTTVTMLDTSDSDSESEPSSSIRFYSIKPRNLVQRRATITGASPSTKRNINIEQFWRELKQKHSTTFQLCDKAASCAHGLDTVPSSFRPQTYLDTEHTNRNKRLNGQIDEKNVQFHEKFADIETFHLKETDQLNKNLKQVQTTESKSQKNMTFNTNTIYCQNSLISDFFISNNINDISVPLETGSHDRNDKISEAIVCHKERNKLDGCYSTPTYNLSENGFAERRLATIVNHSKKSLISSDLRSVSSASLNKTTSHVYNDKEEVNKQCGNTVDIDQNDVDNLEVVSNVAQKVNIIEKSIQCVDTNDKLGSQNVPEQLNLFSNVVRINSNDYNISIEKNKNNIDCMQGHFDDVNCSYVRGKYYVSNNENRSGKCNINNDLLLNNNESSPEYSEERLGSTSSYNEYQDTSNNSDLTIQKISGILKTNDNSITKHTKLTQEKVLSKLLAHSITDKSDRHLGNTWMPFINTNAINGSLNFDIQNADSNTNLSIVQVAEADIQVYMQIKNSNTTSSKVDTYNNVPQFRQYSTIPKVQQMKTPEVKFRSAPQNLPSRKDATKSTSLSLSSTSNFLVNLQIPQVPEISIRNDFKEPESFIEKYRRVDSLESYKNDRIETYYDFMENSNFINDPGIYTSEHKLTQLTDSHGCSVIDKQQCKEKKILLHVMHNEKVNNTNHLGVEQYRMEHNLNNVDTPDDTKCSRQMQSSNLKRKTEKDKYSEKSVVNRAMMVARSIGLHGSSSIPLGPSPRCNRKRNMLLAKRRNVSVKEMGAGDLEGWLIYRSRGAGGAWTTAWFVLKGSCLYKFKAQDSIKADCLIALTGFTVSQASEVKSRKYAFKVYHTGTVFYFATNTDDSLATWFDAINKATLGTDDYQTNGLFSETDESDVENKIKVKDMQTFNCKLSSEKLTSGSLKKSEGKKYGFKDHEMNDASLDRKYLRFLSTRNQNVPVPTAQFRSYRKVLPVSTSVRKQNLIQTSAELQVTVAGSTFYGLNASYNATDVPNINMDDYRRMTDR